MFTSKNPSLVNVINNKSKKREKNLQEGELFYDATQQFKIAFTNGLNNKMNNLKTINVTTNYNAIPENDIDVGAARKLGKQTFGYIGLRKHIWVRI